MFAANDSETEIYYASESPPDLYSDLEENNAHDEDLEAANDPIEDLSNRRNNSDFNTTNMDLDGEYTSEDEEQRPHISPAAGHAFQRLIDPYTTRHHRRSSSQRIRGFSPLNSRLLRRTNAITPSFLTQHVKHNKEHGLENINGAGSKELGQFRLPESSFLRAGMTFSGTQNLMNTQQPSQRDEEWEVKTVHYVNYKTGTAIGLMEALNVPNSSNTVVTYWEGEMIDFVNHSLWTDKWNSTPDIDLQHWKKFDAFRQMDVRRSINALCVFRTVETSANNNDNFSLSQNVKSKNGRILKGKEKEDSKANKTVLREIKQTYSGQVLDCDNRIGQRIFVDSQYESFLMNFLKKSVLQDFRSLAVAKHHVKTLIMKRINGALATCQGHGINNGNDVHLRRRKLEKLIEKLVTQRMAKKEKNKKSENVDDVVRWKSSDDDRQNVSEDFTVNDVNMKIPAMPTFPLLEYDIDEKMTTADETKDRLTDVDCDTKIPRDTLAETCDDSSIVISVKQPLKKTSTDSSRSAPNPKRVKPNSTPPPISFGGSLAQAASFPESKPFTSSGSTSLMSGSSTFNSNQKSTSTTQFSSSSTQKTAMSSPTFTPISSSSSTHNMSMSTNNPLSMAQTPSNRLPYPQINTCQYPTNCYRQFHNSSEDLSPSIRPPVPCIGNKPINGPQGTCENLPGIQGLLAITPPPPPPSQSPLSNGVGVVNQNTPGVVHTPFSTPYRNNFYSFGSSQLSQQTNTGTHSIVTPMSQHLHQMNSPAPQSSTQRHYIPIAPSPTTTAGNRPPLPSSSPAANLYTASMKHKSLLGCAYLEQMVNFAISL
ncbi:7617_t:CDS:2 [Racocetra fulgida]|uniref:7617_t:CDS:1 n=1 Tax=Racocetra fulgida TaxID=60492 RepID=A0A9N8VZT3_9GLOM|nr:7617_t:CDS:2 [Racocetra fulgida]